MRVFAVLLRVTCLTRIQFMVDKCGSFKGQFAGQALEGTWGEGAEAVRHNAFISKRSLFVVS